MSSAAEPRPTTAETTAIVRGPGGAPRRRIGASPLEVFPLALSAKAFGWTATTAATDRILHRYVEHGGNFVDTADSYASGRSEIMIGTWMRNAGNRDELVLATKIGKSAEHPGLGAAAVQGAVEASLRRLGTDRIDLLYLHIDDESVEFDETLLAVDKLIRAGKVRCFGGSDHTGDRLFEARIASAQLGVAQMVALQNEYSLVRRKQYERDLARVAASQGLGVMPRFAIAHGFLSGKFRTRAAVRQSPRSRELAPHLTRGGLKVLGVLDELAVELDASVATVALAWLLTKPHVVAPVVSASEPEQVVDLAAAAELRLRRHHVTALDRVSAWA
ncbi:aldo/keto reductase [Homoserinibacter sp. YIM 151385]|uniref:aldo/keto reductase n=1 Tax=Homoserinibacter sp. YIM 151385 TaxID=2985506 RepID=UPI0022F13FD7|nr:aldo/keto reductase [Homoserinibacter sp. YIM 151385]WBU38917.1 aldo/keto reductase [Homoserinibacter sp. YIM 151385]